MAKPEWLIKREKEQAQEREMQESHSKPENRKSHTLDEWLKEQG